MTLLTYSQFSHLTELSHKDIQFVYTATGFLSEQVVSLLFLHICDIQDRMNDLEITTHIIGQELMVKNGTGESCDG